MATSSTPTLLRRLGLFSATALVISNMVGTGIFTTTGFLAGDLGEPWLVLGIWLVGAVVALAGALSYSELGVNFPASGGEYVYLTRAYGPTLGFMSGWVSFFAGFSAPVATAALAFSNYLGYFFPALRQENIWFRRSWGEISIEAGGAQMAAAALILLFTVLNLFGVEFIARIQNTLTSIKVLVMVAFIGFGLAVGNGDWSHLRQAAERTSATPLVAQFALSLFWIYVGYSGWNAATYIAEELRKPERTLPMALTIGTVLVAILYLLFNVVFIYAVPLEQMKGVLAIGSLTAHALFGPEAAGVFSALLAVSLMSTVNAMVTIGPRLYYAMAKNGAFVPAAGYIHPKWRTPVVAILFQGACAMLMTLVNFGNLMTYIGYLLNLFAMLAVASLFWLRKRPDWQKLPAVSFAFPLVPLLFVVPGVWLVIAGLRFAPAISAAAAATLVSGALVYRYRILPKLKQAGDRPL
jgi:APA family basic amino acid/polyamine antiporter